MFIILLFHSDGDITAVSEYNGSIRAFANAKMALNFIRAWEIFKEHKYKIVRVK